MPPHCDTLDGPVVTMAKKALETKNVNLILPYVPREGEQEVINVFEKVLPLRKQSDIADVADMHFFETVVRIHRAGEGEPYTGLKPAGLSEGPVVPVAERAIETRSPDELLQVLTDIVQAQTKERFNRVMALEQYADGPVDKAREYVEAMLGLQVWSHKLYLCAQSDPHEKVHSHNEGHGHE